jgi:hypothetical protein
MPMMENTNNSKPPFEIIDFHIHPFFNYDRNVCFYEKTVDKLKDLPSDLFRAGISRACGSVIERICCESFNDIKKFNYENYYLDLSGTGIFSYGLISYGVNKAGSDRFLFGTDYPICNPGMYVHAVLFEKLRDKDYEAIFSGSARRILAGHP